MGKHRTVCYCGGGVAFDTIKIDRRTIVYKDHYTMKNKILAVSFSVPIDPGREYGPGNVQENSCFCLIVLGGNAVVHCERIQMIHQEGTAGIPRKYVNNSRDYS